MGLLENFDSKLLTGADNIFMTYENVVQLLDVLIIDFISNTDDSLELFNLSMFNNYSDSNKLIKMLNRKEKNVLSLIVNDKLEYDMMYKAYIKALPLNTDDKFVTDFIKGFSTYASSKCSANRIVIATGDNPNKIGLIYKLLGNNIDKLEFVSDDDETIESFIVNEDFSLILTDRSDLVSRNIDKLNNKIICFPYISYLFETEIVDGETVALSKDRWEVISFNKPFTIGFFEPFKITEDMFCVG